MRPMTPHAASPASTGPSDPISASTTMAPSFADLAKGRPLVVAAEMGYGHLRPARSLALALGVPLFRAESAPLCDEAEAGRWSRVRRGYDALVRASQTPIVGGPFDALLRAITEIPTFHPRRDLRRADLGVTSLRRLIDRGLGAGMVAALRADPRPLLTTFYAPAIVADAHGLDDVWCVITDTDCARIWVSERPESSRVRYLAPSDRVRRRLEAYGVPPEHIHQTGFPLPPQLTGGDDLGALRLNLAARLRRLDPKGRFVAQHRAELETFLPEVEAAADPRPPLLLFAVGGSGAQVDIAVAALPGLLRLVRERRLRLGLIAGIRPEVHAAFVAALGRAGASEAGVDEVIAGSTDGVALVYEPHFDAYAAGFDRMMGAADALWTKTSEMSFYAALGLPIVMAPAVGVQERYNRRWLSEAGAGVEQRPPRDAGDWMIELLHDGVLARAAWTGFLRLPKRGSHEICRLVTGAGPAPGLGIG